MHDEQILEAFKNSVESGKNEDEVKLAMINAGAQFKNVNKLFNDAMIKFNYRISKEDVKDIIVDVVAEKDLSLRDIFTSVVEELIDKVKNFRDEKDAKRALVSHCKKNEIPFYREPKSAGRSGFTNKFYEFLRNSPDCSKEEAAAFINGEGDNEETSENTKRHINHYLSIWKLVNDIYNS